MPLIDGMGRFAGFRGAAVSLRAEDVVAPARTAAGTGSAFGERLDQALRGPLAHIVDNAERLRAQPEGPLRRDYTGYAARHRLGRPPSARRWSTISSTCRRSSGPISVPRPRRSTSPTSPAAPPACSRSAPPTAASASTRPAPARPLPATGDFTRALQILMNLITNAIRYSPEGGQVWIRTEREGDLAAIIVADQGKGIAEEDQERIFEKFERVDPNEPGGTGLGLYIARRLARAMGGDIVGRQRARSGRPLHLHIASQKKCIRHYTTN